MHRQIARPQLQAAIGIRRPGKLFRQIAVFDHLNLAIDRDNVADTLQWLAFAHNLRRHFTAGQHMASQKQFIADLQQWIIDLSVEKVLHAPPLGIRQAAASGRADSMPPWPSGPRKSDRRATPARSARTAHRLPTSSPGRKCGNLRPASRTSLARSRNRRVTSSVAGLVITYSGIRGCHSAVVTASNFSSKI